MKQLKLQWAYIHCIRYGLLFQIKFFFFQLCFGWIEKNTCLRSYHLSFRIFFYDFIIAQCTCAFMGFFLLSYCSVVARWSSLDFSTAQNEKFVFIFKMKISCMSTLLIQHQCIEETFVDSPDDTTNHSHNVSLSLKHVNQLPSMIDSIFFVSNRIDTFYKMLWHVTLFLLPHTK